MTPQSTPVRVLEIRSVRGTGGGPEKTILQSARDADPQRVATTVCYVRDERDEVFGIDRRAAAMGIDYVEVRERHSFDFSAWSKIRRLVQERRIDIVHAHEYKTDLIAWWLGQVENVVPMSTVHGWSGETWRERYVYYPADRMVLARFPQVIAVSSEIRDGLVRAGVPAWRVTTILNAIDHRAFRRDPSRVSEHRSAEGVRSDDVVIGTIGRLEPGKGFEMLIEVFARLRANDARLRLVIVGDGSLRGALEAQAASLLPPGACFLLGHRADVVAAHHVFDLFVHPSDHEGTPNAVLEAMALETPMVATDAGGTAELAQHGAHALIVPCKDPDALERGIADLLAQPGPAAVRAAAARRRVEDTLSFLVRIRRIEDIYEQLAAARSGWRDVRRLQVA